MEIERSERVAITGKEGPWKFVICKSDKDKPYTLTICKEVQGKIDPAWPEVQYDERAMRGMREMLKQVQLPKTAEESMKEPDPGEGKGEA